MKIVLVLGLFIASVQCLELRKERDVSELYSSPGVQTRPIYRPEPSAPQEDLSGGYNYPKPPVQPIQPTYPEPTVVQPRPDYGTPSVVQPPVIVPVPSIEYGPPKPQPQPQPQPIYPETRPQVVYPQPQPRPIYPQPQPTYPQPQPTYPQPQPTYPQPQLTYPQPQPTYPQPQPSYPQPELVERPSTGYDYPNPYAVDRVQPVGQATGTSEKILWNLWNKFSPPSNNYPGTNTIGYPSGNGNFQNKFPFLSNLFPGFKNNYNGQRLETASNQVSTSSFVDNQGYNSIGDTAPAPSPAGGVNGYDYPNPNEQQPPFDLPGISQFRKESNLK